MTPLFTAVSCSVVENNLLPRTTKQRGRCRLTLITKKKEERNEKKKMYRENVFK